MLFYICVSSQPVFTIHYKTLQLPYTVHSIACSTFLRIFDTHTHVNFPLTPYFIRQYYFISCNSYCPITYILAPSHKIVFYFSTKLSVFSQRFFCESHFYSIAVELTFYKSELERTD